MFKVFRVSVYLKTKITGIKTISLVSRSLSMYQYLKPSISRNLSMFKELKPINLIITVYKFKYLSIIKKYYPRVSYSLHYIPFIVKFILKVYAALATMIKKSRYQYYYNL